MGKYSREKGVRGERDIANRLGGKRVGVSYLKTPVDVQLGDWAVVQVKNKTAGGATIAEELGRLKAVAPKMNAYVVFKVKGKWYCAEPLAAADKLLRDKVIAWQKVQEDIKRKAQELADLEAAAAVKRREILESTGEIKEAPKVEPILVPETDTSRVHAGLATAGATTNWKWREKDFSQVPDEYKMLDASKITKVVRAGVRSIPGIEIYPEKGLRVTPIRG